MFLEKNKHQTNYKPKKTKDTIKIISLGGWGEIGKNMMVLEYQDSIIIIDCGIGIPENRLFGIDLVIPDFSYLHKNKDKIKAILLTHGHEDHIGGIPYLLKDFNIPIYGSGFTIGIVKGKIDEHNIKNKPKIKIITPRELYKIGPFKVEFISTTHSIADSCALAIHTNLGTIVHTSDFKIDHTPIDGRLFDFYRFAQLGENGVLLLMSDSTNVEKSGFSISESKLAQNFKNIIEEVSGRLYFATFSSHIHRIQQIVDIAYQNKRKISFSGRSMMRIVEVAQELGYLKIPADTVCSIEEINSLPRNKTVVITSGSQGEPMSALALIANKNHKNLDIQKDDTVILSGGVIPGNEKNVARIVNKLYSHGAKVIYREISDVHVSGHAPQEDLKMMLGITRPQFFIPVHGELKQLIKHSQIAKDIGIPIENMLVSQDGNLIEVSSNKIERIDFIEQKLVLIDGKGVGDIGDQVLREREILSDDGMFTVFVSLRDEGNRFTPKVDFESMGFVYLKENNDLLAASNDIVFSVLDEIVYDKNLDIYSIKQKIRSKLRKYFFDLTKRKPMIIIFISIN